jgi:hypothetical protein
MAVASPRSALTFWIAWVAAAAVGAALAATASFPTSRYTPIDDPAQWISSLLLAAPVALLQFVVLRALLQFSSGTAGLWLGLTLIAAAAQVPALIAWYLGGIPLLGGSSTFSPDGVAWSVDPRWVDLAFAAPQYIAPVLVGIAQGLALLSAFRRPSTIPIWLVTNVLAFVVAGQLTVLVLAGTYFEVRWPSGYVVTMTLYGAFYAVITGAVLVAISARTVVRARVPAAR